MKTITVETSKLSGAALDWAVSAAIGEHDDGDHATMEIGLGRYSPSTDWSQGGSLIEKLVILTQGDDCNWYAIPTSEYGVIELSGQTLLIAACRAIVAAGLGDDVEVPAELVEVKNG